MVISSNKAPEYMTTSERWTCPAE